MNRDKIEKAAYICAIILFGGILLLFLVKRLLPVLSPFIIAFIVAYAVRGPAMKLSKKTRIPEAPLRVFLSLFAASLIFGLLALFLWRLGAALWGFLSGIDEESPIFLFLDALFKDGVPFFGDIIPDGLYEQISDALTSLIGSILTSLGQSLTSWVAFIPSALLYALVTVISLIYFSLDLDRITAFVKAVLPRSVSALLSRIRREAFAVILKYIRSYALILLITLALMLSGFLILRIENAFLTAVIVALLDILPIIGVGTVLIPWSIFAFISGDPARGVGLILLFLVNTVVRQFSEPRIVGKSLDLHPVITLISLYVGYSLFGFFGLVIAPLIAVTVSLIKNDGTAEIDKPLS